MGRKSILRVAENTLWSHFDGNLQGDIRIWAWSDTRKMKDEDFAMLIGAKRLDWVIIPMKESREAR